MLLSNFEDLYVYQNLFPLCISKGSARSLETRVAEHHKPVDGHNLGFLHSLCLAIIFCSFAPNFLLCFYHCLHPVSKGFFLAWNRTFLLSGKNCLEIRCLEINQFPILFFFNIYITISEMPKLFSILNPSSWRSFFFLGPCISFIALYLFLIINVFMQDFEGSTVDRVNAKWSHPKSANYNLSSPGE